MLNPETKKFKEIFNFSSLPILKSDILPERRFKDVHTFTPSFTGRVSKMIAPLIALCLLFVILGCGGNSSDTTITTSSAKAIKTFSLNGVAGTINEAEKTIAVTMPAGTDVTALVATFTTTGASVAVDEVVQESGTTDNDFTNPVIYTVTAADASTEGYTVTVIVAGKSITTFSLNGVAGTIDEAAKTIVVTMPSETDVTALVATFTTTGASVTVGSTVQVNGITANNFTTPVVYTVTAIDAETQVYTVTVVTEPVNKPATAITVSMTPNNAGTDPVVPPGDYCARTPSITGSFVVTDPDGGSVVVTEWYDNGSLVQSNTITLPSGVTSGSETIYNGHPRFVHGHVISFKATADGVPSNTVKSTPIT
jgi:hypothetical protein